MRIKRILFTLFLIGFQTIQPVFSETQNPQNHSEEKYQIKEYLDKEIADKYILGPGDSINILFRGIEEISGIYNIRSDGSVVLPRIDNVYVEGLTLDELDKALTEKYKSILIDPNIVLRIASYRPIKIFIRGEIATPGYYVLQNEPNLLSERTSLSRLNPGTTIAYRPTIFDALQKAGGITANSNLKEIIVKRKASISEGSGFKKAKFNLLNLFTEGDSSQNIKLSDGDSIFVPMNKLALKKDLLELINKSNLSPASIVIFIGGKVPGKGMVDLPRGSYLNQAILRVGGVEFLNGPIELIRFSSDGTIEKRVFNYSPKAAKDSYKNPLLISGDMIRVKNSPLGIAKDLVGEVLPVALSFDALYRLIN